MALTRRLGLIVAGLKRRKVIEWVDGYDHNQAGSGDGERAVN